MGIDAAVWVVLLKIKETSFQRSNISFSLVYRERYLFWEASIVCTCIVTEYEHWTRFNKKKLRTIIPLIEALNGMKSHHLSHATSGRFIEIVLKNLEKKFTNFFEVRWYHFFSFSEMILFFHVEIRELNFIKYK